ncbi:LpxI family protein [Cerasicoccus fimbriatus]|uniref:LpxI family protein n=1 Tax=Cerasicoccus fimbriatus TaxID=3014554 RepID=UPI0022B54B87|nr:UDP-2,3-diacylglucosamine diphosphatase LpxI [Cerasicoccus sp. TK19100]
MSLSRFLPADFDPAQPVAVIAGQRLYPVLTVERLRQAGVPVRLIAFEGETRLDLFESFAESERAMIKVGQVGHMLKALKRFGARSSMMVGQITPRRLFDGLHPDLKAVTLLAKLKRRNAETIFGALAEEMAKIGCQLLDARAFLDDQMADTGVMTAGKFQPDADSLQHGVHICREMARLDVGQGVVVSRGTVVAVEAFEGTDDMLQRAGSFGAKETLFIKTVKPKQDYRFDVPVFGEKTLETMAEHGIKAAALEANNVIMLDKANVLASAKQKGVTLIGF